MALLQWQSPEVFSGALDARRESKGSVADTDPGYLSVAPCLITAEQHAALLRPFDRSPEIGLLVAVMADAVSVLLAHLRRPDAKRLREFKEAEEWFASDDISGPFSFLNICSVLDFEPAAVLRALSAVRDGGIWAPSRGSRKIVRRGGGRRHCVGPGPAAPMNQARQAHSVQGGRDARGAEDATSARARRPRGAA